MRQYFILLLASGTLGAVTGFMVSLDIAVGFIAGLFISIALFFGAVSGEVRLVGLVEATITWITVDLVRDTDPLYFDSVTDILVYVNTIVGGLFSLTLYTAMLVIFLKRSRLVLPVAPPRGPGPKGGLPISSPSRNREGLSRYA